jgi:hypothetical protein
MRSWSPKARINARLLARARVMESKRIEVEVLWHPGGGLHIPDIRTRVDDRYELMREGAVWTRTTSVDCRCTGMCEHLRHAVERLIELSLRQAGNR